MKPGAARHRAGAWQAVLPGWAGSWLRGSRLGLLVLALLVGVGSGLGAVAFRYLISAFTWLATGHVAFGQQDRVAPTSLPAGATPVGIVVT